MSKHCVYLVSVLLMSLLSLADSAPTFALSRFHLDLGRLWLDRKGDNANAYMRTVKVLAPVLSPKFSVFIKNGTVARSSVPGRPPQKIQGIKPPQTCFTGMWKGKNEGESKGSVLGGIGELIMVKSIINIPVVTASRENLAHYDARLILDGDVLDVESPVPLVMTDISVGETYVSDFLMNKKYGGGAYLEYHDTPHFHMPQDKEADGVLILGARENELFCLTAFKILYGSGVYTPPYVLHSDAHLVGRYMVMYTYTENFSTVNLKTEKDELVEVRFVHNRVSFTTE